MSEPALPTPTTAELCRNCDAQLQGHFCHSCGQPHKPLDPTFKDLWHEGVHEFLHIDGKILHTVKLLLLRPGFLTAEFLAGRRARYMGPFRLYLTISLIFFFLLLHLPAEKTVIQNGTSTNDVLSTVNNTQDASTPENGAAAKKIEDSVQAKINTPSTTPSATPAPAPSTAKTDAAKNTNTDTDTDNDEDIDAAVETQVAAAKKIATQNPRHHGAIHDLLKSAIVDMKANPEEFHRRLNEQTSHMMFVMLPLFALILRRIYRGSGQHYPACLYFSIHIHCLFFLLLTFAALLQFATRGFLEVPSGIVPLAAAVYLFLALRRVFEGTVRQTLWRMTKIAALYLPCLLLGLGGAALSALFLRH
jgi:hypothetical protein